MADKSKLTGQSQVSVPAGVRRKLGLHPGSLMVWEDAGEYVVVRRLGAHSSADIHAALFDHKPAKKSLKTLKAGIAAHMRKRHARD